jgi:catechol 2,3-dioxygenase-like lactoylglutathione lyase family enzyme
MSGTDPQRAPSPRRPPPIGGVLETVLYYPPGMQDAMAAFYEGILGLRSIGRSPERFLFYRTGASVFLLFDFEAAGQQDSPPPHGASGPGHACFVVPRETYGEWKRYLAERGVDVEEELEWPRGGRSFYFRDPAGNALEIADRDVWPS